VNDLNAREPCCPDLLVDLNIVIYIVDNIIKDNLALCIREILFNDSFLDF